MTLYWAPLPLVEGVKGMCVHSLFICALSHTSGSHIHNLWSVDYLLDSALLKVLTEKNLHHFDCLSPRSDDQEVTYGRRRNHNRTTKIQCPVYGVVRCCTSLENLHQRGHYLFDALHRTNYAGQCQSGTVHCGQLPSMKDIKEMVPDVRAF